MAVILVTYDLGVIAGRADRVAGMYAGKIAETTDTGEASLKAAKQTRSDSASHGPGSGKRAQRHRCVSRFKRRFQSSAPRSGRCETPLPLEI
jgi:ABC-type dipeptide/oligopeptide/nickel transport system ATPase component